MSLGSFSRYMTEKHGGNVVDKFVMGRNIFISGGYNYVWIVGYIGDREAADF